jgi:hypothetical protein
LSVETGSRALSVETGYTEKSAWTRWSARNFDFIWIWSQNLCFKMNWWGLGLWNDFVSTHCVIILFQFDDKILCFKLNWTGRWLRNDFIWILPLYLNFATEL